MTSLYIPKIVQFLVLGNLFIILLLYIVVDWTGLGNSDGNQGPAEKLYLENIFRQLDLYPSSDLSHKLESYDTTRQYSKGYFGLKRSKKYCDIVDMKNLLNPERIYKDMVFYCLYRDNSMTREVLQEMGTLANPESTMNMTDEESEQTSYRIDTDITLFYTKKQNFHTKFELGRHMGCLSQMYGHLPGHWLLSEKEGNAEMVKTYRQKFGNRTKQCVDKEFHYPTSYRLLEKEECEEFFSIILSRQYHERKKDEPIQYLIKKNNVHKGLGVELLTDELEQELSDMYKKGSLCGIEEKNYIAQKYISNPLLLDWGNKFDFRIYLLIASVNPLIAYYHDGFAKATLDKFDKFSKDKTTHLSNTNIASEYFELANITAKFNMTSEQLKEYQTWTYQEIQDYLLESGKINDTNWIDNYLRPSVKKIFIHLSRMIEPYLYRSSSVFEMFGVDFMLDENFNLWFIECNPSPQMEGTSPEKKAIQTEAMKDMMEIEHAYLRNRWKRMTEMVELYYEKEWFREKRENWEGKFKEALRNKIDGGYKIPKKNSWHKIVDKNTLGVEAFQGFIDEDCLIDDDFKDMSMIDPQETAE